MQLKKVLGSKTFILKKWVSKLENNKDKRNFLWIYTVILFSSAFIVLFLTGLSQVRLANNIEEYKKKLKEHEKSIQGFNLSLNSASKENWSLRQKIELLEKENSSLKSIIEDLNKLKLIQSQLERSKLSFDLLLKATDFFKKGDYVSCAEALRDVFEEDLGQEARKKYKYLKSKVYFYTMKYFYYKGIKEFEKRNYLQAREYFLKSLNYDDTKYFEENSLYYIALISSKLGETEKLRQYANALITKYPNSEYVKRIKPFLK